MRGDHEGRVGCVENLVHEIVFKVLEQITLRLGVKVETGFVEEQDCVIRIAAIRVGCEDDVKREEPLEATAPLVEIYLDVVYGVRVRNQCVEVLSVEVETDF